MLVQADYQQFSTDLSFIGERMQKKLEAFPHISFDGKRVLDVGCDHGFWCIYAANQGASEVIGLDRGREVKGRGFVDLASENFSGSYPIAYINHHCGRQWMEYGKFDIILVQSVFHHIFQSAGGCSEAIWYWLRRQIKEDGALIWEGPLTAEDPVIYGNVDTILHKRYESVLDQPYFDVEYYGPSLHEKTRHYYILRPTEWIEESYMGKCVSKGESKYASGGATVAFQAFNGRRLKELEYALGEKLVIGTCNILCDAEFNWEAGYYVAPLMDVVDRSTGFSGEWAPRWCGLYPMEVDRKKAYAMRFANERYPLHFVEAISSEHLKSDVVEIKRLI